MTPENVVIKGRITGTERLIPREVYDELTSKGLLKADVIRVVPVAPEPLKVEKENRKKANTLPNTESTDSAGEA